MIRFIDLTEDYWTDPACGFPICAFLSTDNGKFIECIHTGEMTFSTMGEVLDQPLGERMSRLTPKGFFERGWQCPRERDSGVPCNSCECPHCYPAGPGVMP